MKDVIYQIHFKEISLSGFAGYLDGSNCPYNEDELRDIIRIMAKKHIVSTKFNCSYRCASFLYCKRTDGQCDNYNIPNIVSAIFSSNKPLIFNCCSARLSAQNVRCVISVEEMDTGYDCGRIIARCDNYNIPNIVSTIFSSDKPLIFYYFVVLVPYQYQWKKWILERKSSNHSDRCLEMELESLCRNEYS